MNTAISTGAEDHTKALTGAWWAVFVLTVLYTSSFIDRSILGLLVAPIRRDFGISDFYVGLLQGTAFALFYTLLGLPAGRLADRVSRRALVFCGVGLWSIATALCGATSSFWQLFAARVGVGVGDATLMPGAHSLLADLFPPKQRGRAFSIYHMGVSVGQGAALIVGGLVVRAVANADSLTVPVFGSMRSWQVVFLIVGLPGLLLTPLALTMREPARTRDPAAIPTFREAFAFAGRHKAAFGFYLAGVVMYSIVLFGYPQWMPTVFVRRFGMAMGNIGPIYGTILLVAGPFGLIVAGSICDALHKRSDSDAYWKVVTAIGVCCLPFAIAAPLMPNPTLAFVMLAFEAVTIHAFSGVGAAALVSAVPPRLRGQITALHMVTAAIVGIGLGPPLIGAFTTYVYGRDDAVGWSLATVCAIVLPLSTVFLFIARRPFRIVSEEVAAANAAAGLH